MNGWSFPSRRSAVMATRGMVATSQPLATLAGLDMLRAGGTAADAAVAAAAVLNVVEPMSTGVGGDAFALIYEAATGQVHALNGSGRSPAAASIPEYQRRGLTEMPQTGILSVTVPGTVRAWSDLLERFGRLGWDTVLAPAIHYAEHGFAVTELIAQSWQRAEKKLAADPFAQAAYLPHGRAPRPGEVVTHPDLARTLRQIAHEGADAFYQGEIAHRLVQRSNELGGLLTLDDLARHQSTWDVPISTTYRDVTVYECPPNGQGLIALLALNILNGYDLRVRGHNTVATLHLVIEALKLAFADGHAFIADPSFAPAPLSQLLSADYATRQRTRIDPDQATAVHIRGSLGTDTVYLTAIDEMGNAVSFINSLYEGFGAGIVVPGTGVCLQNRGALFTLDPDHPNRLDPCKRPYHTIIPALALQDGQLFLSFGVMGGFMQPQGHVQILCNIIDFGMDPQRALDAPRIRIANEQRVLIESGIDLSVLAGLQQLGHKAELYTGPVTGYFGGGQIILRDHEQGTLWGGSDPRKDGCALGY